MSAKQLLKLIFIFHCSYFLKSLAFGSFIVNTSGLSTQQLLTTGHSVHNETNEGTINGTSDLLVSTDSSTMEYEYVEFPQSSESIDMLQFLQGALYKMTTYLSQIMLRGVGLFALITNGLCFIIFIRMHRRKQQIMSVFIAISVVDTWSLVSSFDYAFSSAFKVSLLKFNFFCKLFNWLQSASQVSSSLFVLLFTTERYISVRFPLKRAVICTKRRINGAMIAIAVVSLVMEAFVPYFLAAINGTCYSPNGRGSEVFTSCRLIIHLAIGIISPYIIIGILNALIIYQMLQYRRKRAAMATNVGDSSDDSAQRSLTLMLVVVSSYSFVTTFPRLVAFAFNPSEGEAKNNSVRLFTMWASAIIAPLNYCGNFFFYILSGRQFRQEFVRLILCRQATAGSLGATTRMSNVSSGGSVSSVRTNSSAVKMQSLESTPTKCDKK